MKNLIILIIIFIFCSVVIGQEFAQEELSRKLKSSLKMKNTGKMLTGLGVASFVVGVGFLIKGINESNEYTRQFNQGNYDNLNDDGAASGRVARILFIGGTAFSISEVTLWIVAGTKSNRYMRLLDESRNKLTFDFSKRGIGLKLYF